jgi:2-polyprenyl-3-methyl-5-hydroxy-6-metoxy-1,4-benzoquinol methylase
MVGSIAEAAWTFRRSIARLLRKATKARDPHSASAFEVQYATDGWSSLRSIHEAPRYGVVAGYAHHLGAASVLDIGCGEGLLLGYLPAGIRYCGVDFSETAVATARAAFGGDRAIFDVVDAETYKPREKYDLIVLNEVLYSLVHPGRVIARCVEHLATGGHVIVSCDTSPQKDKIWPIVSAYLQSVDILVLQSTFGGRWAIRLLRPVSS